MARRPRFVQRSFTKRATFWGRSPADTVVTSLAAGAAVLDSTAVPIVQGETIVRTRGHIAIQSDQLSGGENLVGAVGMAIASDEAVAVGVGSLPTPYTDSDSELWFMHEFFSHSFKFTDATGWQEQGFSIWKFDSKAMRKMESSQTLIVVVENGTASFGLQYFLNYAVLFKVA